MKVTTILAALLVLATAAPIASAAKPGKKKGEAGSFAKYDTNGNGVLDADEKAAVQKAFGTDSDLKQYDINGDGKLDENEVAAIKSESKKGKKKNK